MSKPIASSRIVSVIALMVVGVAASGRRQLDPPKTARYYRQQAAAAYKAKDYAEAIDNLNKALEILEANNAVFLEPTLGVLVKDTFYFIANSQWPLVEENGKLAAEDKLRNPVVLKMNLEARQR